MMYEQQQQQQVQMNMNMMRSKRQVDLDKKRRNNNSEEEDNKLQIVDLSGISLDSLPNPPLNLATICKLDLSNNNLQMFEAWKKDYGSRLRKKKNGWGRHG